MAFLLASLPVQGTAAEKSCGTVNVGTWGTWLAPEALLRLGVKEKLFGCLNVQLVDFVGISNFVAALDANQIQLASAALAAAKPNKTIVGVFSNQTHYGIMGRPGLRGAMGGKIIATHICSNKRVKDGNVPSLEVARAFEALVEAGKVPGVSRVYCGTKEQFLEQYPNGNPETVVFEIHTGAGSRDRFAAALEGTADLAIAADPHYLKAKKVGLEVYWVSTDLPKVPLYSFVANNDWLADHSNQKIVREFMAGVIRSYKFAKKHPQETKALLEKNIGIADPKDLERLYQDLLDAWSVQGKVDDGAMERLSLFLYPPYQRGEDGKAPKIPYNFSLVSDPADVSLR